MLDIKSSKPEVECYTKRRRRMDQLICVDFNAFDFLKRNMSNSEERNTSSEVALLDNVSTGDTDNSMIQSPSIESFSTIQDTETVDLNMDINPHFYVKIDSPEKQLDMLETYITFRIISNVNREGYSQEEYVVRRRYNDFLWLRQQLVESHPFCIVPPLPAKHSLVGQLDRYAKDFILVRMKSLNVFITRIGNHPVLSYNEQLKVFLTAEAKDFATHKSQKSLLHNHSSMKSLTNSEVSESCHSELQKTNIEYEKTKSYLNTLTDKLSNFDKITSRITKERADLVSEINNLHPVFTAWSGSEPELRIVLENIGKALEKTSLSQGVLSHSDPTAMCTSVKDFLQYVEVVQATLRKRDSAQCSYENSLEELNRKKGEKEKLLANSHDNSQHSSNSLWNNHVKNEDKLQKLVQTIPQLAKKSELDQERLETANDVLKKDLELWQEEKRLFLKKMLLEFVNRQIDCFQSNISAWEEVTGQLSQQENNLTQNGTVSK